MLLWKTEYSMKALQQCAKTATTVTKVYNTT